MNEVNVSIGDVNQLIIADNEGEIAIYSRLDDDSFSYILKNVNYEYWCDVCWESYYPEETEDGKCPLCHGDGEPLIIPEQAVIKEYNIRIADNERKKKIFINGVCVFDTLS